MNCPLSLLMYYSRCNFMPTGNYTKYDGTKSYRALLSDCTVQCTMYYIVHTQPNSHFVLCFNSLSVTWSNEYIISSYANGHFMNTLMVRLTSILTSFYINFSAIFVKRYTNLYTVTLQVQLS